MVQQGFSQRYDRPKWIIIQSLVNINQFFLIKIILIAYLITMNTKKKNNTYVFGSVSQYQAPIDVLIDIIVRTTIKN